MCAFRYESAELELARLEQERDEAQTRAEKLEELKKTNKRLKKEVKELEAGGGGSTSTAQSQRVAELEGLLAVATGQASQETLIQLVS